MRLKLGVLLAAAVSAAVLAADAQACACCADPGQWFERGAEIGSAELGELGRVRFGPVARLFVSGGGGLEAVNGVTSPSSTYALTVTRSGRLWTFRFRDARGRSGALAFHVPVDATEFGADLHDGKPASGGGPLLYKELRLADGLVAGIGIFPRVKAGASIATLVLQGRGNNCISIDDYKTWVLEVFGPTGSGIYFSFYGALRRPAR